MPDTPTDSLVVSARSTLRRKRERGNYERALVHAILDEGLLCHVGFQAENLTFVQPMAYARVDEVLYLHGASGNRMLRRLAEGADACVTVTLLDAIVFSRSAFHHSMNYRSVMLFGTAQRVGDEQEMHRAVRALLDHMAPGRSGDARRPTGAELRATMILRFPIDDGSAKVRAEGPIEEPEDLGLAVWGGQLPLRLVASDPVPDEHVGPDMAPPSYLRPYADRRRAQPAPTPSGSAPTGTVEPGG
jgi:nitroimidazol reductase NimA-like FMN-containing flavoprotein (pyridoxamine 5'-phosphate oxidase superfamily)